MIPSLGVDEAQDHAPRDVRARPADLKPKQLQTAKKHTGVDQASVTAVRPRGEEQEAATPADRDILAIDATEEIVQRIVQLLLDQINGPSHLLDTEAVARMISMSQEWVRDHAAELGAIRVGDGPKGTLRFDAREVRTALERRRLEPPQQKQRRRPGPRRRSVGVRPAAVPADVKDW